MSIGLEEGLKSIIKPYDHVFIWKLAKGASPAGSGEQYRLQEIQIFEPGKKELMVTMEIPPSDPPNPSATESEVTIKDNKVFVPVILGYKDREIETTLLFDTGAGSMVSTACASMPSRIYVSGKARSTRISPRRTTW